MSSIFDGILVLLIKVVTFIINLIFGWVHVPDAPSSLTDTINNYMDLIFNNLSVLNFFIDVGFLNTIFSLFLAVFTFRYTFKFLLFVLNHVPAVAVKWKEFFNFFN